MSIALLDVNVLIALMDSGHVAHQRVHAWAERGLDGGWASCALTQNGVVRVMSQPRYPGALSVAAACALLAEAAADPRHTFWPCDIPLVGDAIVPERLLGHRQITDSYLLALAAAHGGRFVTLDTRIDPATVVGAGSRHVVQI